MRDEQSLLTWGGQKRAGWNFHNHSPFRRFCLFECFQLDANGNWPKKWKKTLDARACNSHGTFPPQANPGRSCQSAPHCNEYVIKKRTREAAVPFNSLKNVSTVFWNNLIAANPKVLRWFFVAYSAYEPMRASKFRRHSLIKTSYYSLEKKMLRFSYHTIYWMREWILYATVFMCSKLLPSPFRFTTINPITIDQRALSIT